jgi:hypothetical protein
MAALSHNPTHPIEDEDVLAASNRLLIIEERERALSEDEPVIDFCRSLSIGERRRALLHLLAQIATEYCPNGAQPDEKDVIIEFASAFPFLSDASTERLLFALLKLHNRICDLELKRITRRRNLVWSLKQLEKRTPKPRKRERDAEIVRLHDEKGMSFGKIGQHLPTLNAAWVGRGGTPLGREAVERAYHRMKKALKRANPGD